MATAMTKTTTALTTTMTMIATTSLRRFPQRCTPSSITAVSEDPAGDPAEEAAGGSSQVRSSVSRSARARAPPRRSSRPHVSRPSHLAPHDLAPRGPRMPRGPRAPCGPRVPHAPSLVARGPRARHVLRQDLSCSNSLAPRACTAASKASAMAAAIYRSKGGGAGA